ncbi:MAG: hypothetical protein R3B70_33970 [Polyangiaceae bacterium]
MANPHQGPARLGSPEFPPPHGRGRRRVRARTLKLLNFIADEGGSAMADEGACASVNRSVHMVGGNGSFG